jgi:GAF domain-containing protein
MTREDLLARTFVELADVWVDNFESARLGEMISQRCVELFGAAAAGIFLVDTQGHLGVTGSSSDQVHELQLFELRAGQGPSVDCYRSGLVVEAPDLELDRQRWSRFAPAALTSGFRSIQAVPVRVRDQVIGSLSLFHAVAGIVDAADLLAVQAVAQATAFTILHQRAAGDAEDATHNAALVLDELLLVEQAKGVLAGRAGISVESALGRIRRYARYHDMALTRVCQDIVTGSLTLLTTAETRRNRRGRP